MRSRIILVASLFFITACKHEMKNTSEKDESSPEKQRLLDRLNSPTVIAHADARIQRYTQLLDTNNMDVRTMPIVVQYASSSDTTIINKQKRFIQASGFPISAPAKSIQPITANGADASNTLAINSLKMNLAEANDQYKNFSAGHAGDPSLGVFRQYAASLVIRKYMMNGAAQKNDLKYYTDELIRSNSQDYGTVYFALNAIRNDITVSKLNEYKTLVRNNADGIKFRKKCQVLHDLALEQSKKVSGGAVKMMEAQALLFEVPIARANFFMNKIDKIQTANTDIN